MAAIRTSDLGVTLAALKLFNFCVLVGIKAAIVKK
jgi:hypothetical protein